jgi:16S rRNA (adenine1518-N6/adenine1519-N6)-dimethyltransferase
MTEGCLTSREYLHQVLSEVQATAKKSLGQNFLVGDHVVDRIISEAKSQRPEVLIEIGPGPGALTRYLSTFDVKKYTLIELDRVWADYWRSKNQTVLEEDALRTDWSSLIQGSPCVLVSNLPYQISSSLVIDRSVDQKPLDVMILMFQREVAQRIKADLKDSNYGMLSVVAQTFWKIHQVIDAGPSEFSPAPKVSSRVLCFVQKPTKLDRLRYLKFVKAAFVHPRKLLVSNWNEAYGLTKEKSIPALAKKGFHDKIRPAELKVQDYIDLFAEIG